MEVEANGGTDTGGRRKVGVKTNEFGGCGNGRPHGGLTRK